MVYKNKYFLVLSGLVLVFGVYLFLINSQTHARQDKAWQTAKSRVNELIGNNHILISGSSMSCYSESLLDYLAKHRSCAVTETAYWAVIDDENIDKSIYESVTTNKGWWVLDNGRLNSFGFDKQGYLIGTTTEGQWGEAFKSNLTVRIINPEDIDELLSQLNEFDLQTLKNSQQTIVQIDVVTQYEG